MTLQLHCLYFLTTIGNSQGTYACDVADAHAMFKLGGTSMLCVVGAGMQLLRLQEEEEEEQGR
jgi:preprotein translocase subunit SecY